MLAEIEGFFNLVYSHLLELYASDSPEIKIHLETLLQVVSSAPADKAFLKYRMFVTYHLSLACDSYHACLDYQDSSTLYRGHLP